MWYDMFHQEYPFLSVAKRSRDASIYQEELECCYCKWIQRVTSEVYTLFR